MPNLRICQQMCVQAPEGRNGARVGLRRRRQENRCSEKFGTSLFGERFGLSGWNSIFVICAADIIIGVLQITIPGSDKRF